MHYAQRKKIFFRFFRYFYFYPIDKQNLMCYYVGAREEKLPASKRKEDLPMQNSEEPFHSGAYRRENDKIARILRTAIGSSANNR